MPVNAKFYAELRKPLHGKPALFPVFTQQQVDALNTLTTVFDHFAGHDHCADDLAYIMATCYRECGASLNLAIEEYGHGSRKPYGKPTGPWNKKYYGRGPPQVTWLSNYQTAKLATGIDFVQFPELMCDPSKGVVYMIEAMYAGRFTKHSLRSYINPAVRSTLAVFEQCRRIINGMDHATEIAYTALAFQSALTAGYTMPAAVLVKGQPTSKAQLSRHIALWAGIRKLFGGK